MKIQILSQLGREDRLAIVESLSLEAPKTKLLAGRLRSMGLESTLILTDSADENLYLAARNLPHVLVLEAKDMADIRRVLGAVAPVLFVHPGHHLGKLCQVHAILSFGANSGQRVETGHFTSIFKHDYTIPRPLLQPGAVAALHLGAVRCCPWPFASLH